MSEDKKRDIGAHAAGAVLNLVFSLILNGTEGNWSPWFFGAACGMGACAVGDWIRSHSPA